MGKYSGGAGAAGGGGGEGDGEEGDAGQGSHFTVYMTNLECQTSISFPRFKELLQFNEIFSSRMWNCKPTETKRPGIPDSLRDNSYFMKNCCHILTILTWHKLPPVIFRFVPNELKVVSLTRYKLQFQKETKKELAESRERAHNPIQVSSFKTFSQSDQGAWTVVPTPPPPSQ